jgi:hypothetical protein
MNNSIASLLVAASAKETVSGLNRICPLAASRFRSGATFAVLAQCIALAGLYTAAATQASAQAQTAPAAANDQDKPPAKPSQIGVAAQPEDPARGAWRAAMLTTQRQKETCATATYPERKWHEVPCGPPPNRRPVAPRKRIGSHLGGNQFISDLSLRANGKIEMAEGSFDRVEGVTSEFGGASGVSSENVTGVPNSFSLQLNSNTFYTPTCSSAAGCQGWVQFIYNSILHSASIEYWLLGYGTSCPPGWTFDGTDSCSRDSRSISTPPVTIADLHSMKLTGSIGGHWGNPYDDVVAIQINDLLYAQWSGDPIGGAVNGWTEMEFNVFGDGNFDEATFNLGSTLVVRDSILLGTPTKIECAQEGTSGESNNLILSSESPLVAAVGPPSLVFIETYSKENKAIGGCSNAVLVQGNNTRIPINPVVAREP